MHLQSRNVTTPVPQTHKVLLSAPFISSYDLPVAVFVGANAAEFAGRLKVLHLAGNPSRRYLKKIGKFHFRNEWICPHILLYLHRQRI